MAASSVIHAKTDRPGGPPKVPPGPKLLWWSARHPPEDPTLPSSLGAARLLLGVRLIAKGNEAKVKIVEKTGFPARDIYVLQVDLTSFTSVQEFVEELDKAADHIDVVSLNAGVRPPSFKESPQGWEMAVQVNVLSIALMALLLLAKLRASAQARRGGLMHMVFVNSIAHADVKREWFQNTTLLTAANDEKSSDA